jgi:hypothetical protein
LLSDFTRLVLTECGIGANQDELDQLPNSNFPVYKFEAKKATGKQLLKWIGEICCRNIRVVDSALSLIPVVSFSWYEDSGVTLKQSGKDYYNSGSSFSTFNSPEIQSVHVFMPEDPDGDRYLYPGFHGEDYGKKHDYYTIVDNPIFYAIPRTELQIPIDEEAFLSYLNVIKNEMSNLGCTPCKLSIPSRPDIHVGSIFEYVDFDGNTHKALCMKKTTKANKDTIECTGTKQRKQYQS